MLLLLDLPSELLLCIAEKLPSLRDINAFMRANRRLSTLLNPYLYLCDVQDDENWAISWAALHGKHATAVKHLEARKYAKSLSALEKALFEAIRKEHDSIVELLLATDGINPNLRGFHGDTPLSLAVEVGNERVVKLLLAADGINPNSQDSDGRTALSCAAGEGHETIIKLLLAADGIEPDCPDFHGWTPLFYAVCNRHEAVVKLLLATNGVDHDAKSSEEETPLFLAAFYGAEKIVKLLLHNGANPNSQDIYGLTPLTSARRCGHEGVVKLLHSANGIKPHSSDF